MIFWNHTLRLCISNAYEQSKKPSRCYPISCFTNDNYHFISMLGLSSTKGIYALCILWAQCVWNVRATVWQMFWSVLLILFNNQLWQSWRSPLMSKLSLWRVATTEKQSSSSRFYAAVSDMEWTKRTWGVQATYSIGYREKEHEWI